MRLLVITSSFHPVVGGAETYAFELSRQLAGRGHSVTVVTDVPRGLEPGAPITGDPSGVRVYRLAGHRDLLADPSKIFWEQMAFGTYPELADVLDAAAPDVVLTNSLDVAVLGRTAALDRGVPWVATFHEQAPEREPLGRGRLRLVYGLLRPDLVIAGSRFYAERAEPFGAQVELIYHGVDTDVFHPAVDPAPVRRHYGYTDENIVIVTAGRLKERKGIRESIHAFASVHARHPQTRLLVVGTINSASLEYAQQINDDIADLGLGNVVVIDQTVTFDRMPAVLAAADIVAAPSREEGLGLAVLEAMSTGRATVTTDIPGIREILTTPDIALVVPAAQPQALADALAALVTKPPLRENLAVNGRTHILAHFSRKRMIEQTEAALLAVTVLGDSTGRNPEHV